MGLTARLLLCRPLVFTVPEIPAAQMSTLSLPEKKTKGPLSPEEAIASPPAGTGATSQTE